MTDTWASEIPTSTTKIKFWKTESEHYEAGGRDGYIVEEV